MLKILEPLMTEKSLNLASRGWYSFMVNREAKKREIAQRIGAQLKVHVTNVRTISVKGKTTRTGKKRLLKSASPWKKAMVHLKPNEKIDLFAVETPKK